MMGRVKDDFLFANFGANWPRATNSLADTSTKRTWHSKWWHKRMETKRNFFNQFLHPVFSGFDQNQLIICDISWKNNYQAVPKLMIVLPKRDKWNKRRKLISHFTIYWTRLTGWIIIKPKTALGLLIRNLARYRRKERSQTLQKESELKYQAVVTLIQAVFCFSST